MRNDELVRRVMAASPGAFQELFYKYVDAVYRQIANIVGPHADVEDLTQAVFMRVHRSIATYRFEASFSTWMRRIAIHVALNYLRDTQKHRAQQQLDHSLDLSLPSTDATPAVIAAQREELELMYQLLDRLNDRKRLVFVLYEVEGHTLEEIGELIGCSPNTAASRLRAARKELRRGMERHLQGKQLAGVRRRA